MAYQPYLSKRIVAAYSCGHVFNDAAASCWFSYLLLYLQDVRGLSGVEAGIVLFCGQLADAMATPVAGILSDRGGGCARLGFGRRKFWNFVGVVTVAISFYLLFAACVACDLDPHVSVAGKAATFALAASVFNVGWAFVQVSHMALVPDLTPHEDERVLLNSARYGATILANLLVFVAMVGLLGADSTAPQSSDLLAQAYRSLTLIVLGVGLTASALFLLGTPEQRPGKAPYGRLRDDDGAGDYEDAPILHVATVPPAGLLADGGGGSAGVPPRSLGADGGTSAGAAGADGGGGSHKHVHPDVTKYGGLSHHDEPLYAPPTVAGHVSDGSDGDDDDLLHGGGGGSSIAGGSAPHDGGAQHQHHHHHHVHVPVDDGVPHLQIRVSPLTMTWRDWLVSPAFWVVAMVYMLTRLATNVSQVYLSIYVKQTLAMPSTAIATVPLLVFLSSLGATIGMKRLSARLGWMWAFGAGAGAMALACGGMIIATPHSSWIVYPSAMFLGLGVAVVSVLSVTAEADLIGTYTESGAFVYGAISLTDKLSNGAAVMVIQAVGDRLSTPSVHATYVRYVNSLVPLVSIALAVVVATRLASQPPPSPSPVASPLPAAAAPAAGGSALRRESGAEVDKSPARSKGAFAVSRKPSPPRRGSKGAASYASTAIGGDSTASAGGASDASDAAQLSASLLDNDHIGRGTTYQQAAGGSADFAAAVVGGGGGSFSLERSSAAVRSFDGMRRSAASRKH